MPTARAPTGSSRKMVSCPDCACNLMGDTSRMTAMPAAAATAIRVVRSARTLGGRCLINQHYRNAVPDGVSELIVLADQGIFGFAILKRPLALGANEDLE